jgi:PAS domain S-box-containing protein
MMSGAARLSSAHSWARRHPRLAAFYAIDAVVVALLLRFAIDRSLPPGLPFLTFFPAVVLVTYCLGARAGIICATLSGLVAWYFFIPPFDTFVINPSIAIALGFYVFVVGLEIGLFHAVQRRAAKVQDAHAEIAKVSLTLEEQVAARTQELQAAATLQAAILNHAGYAIIATDELGVITLFNPAAEQMLGHAATEVVGRADPSLFHEPEGLAAHAQRMSSELGRPFEPGFEALSANVPDAGAELREWTFRTKHGESVPVLVNFSRLKGEDGRCIGYLKIVGDLRQSRRHEAELKAAGAGTWKVNIKAGRVWCSAETARQHDLTEEPIELDLERDWRPIAHPDDAGRVLAELAAATAGGRMFSSEFRVRRRDGSIRWITALGEVERDGKGEPVAVVGLSLDTTARKKAELALRESEQRYRMLAENTVDMIVQTDLQSLRRYVSPGCRRVLGYEPEELVAHDAQEIVHPEDLPAVEALVADLVAGRRTRAVLEQRYRRKDGSFIWVEVSYGVVVDSHGAPAALMLSARDVTERRAQAEALQRAMREAERASRAKTDFLAAMSHEIRTPLNAIIGFTDLMVASGRLDPEMQRRAQLVRTSGAALLTIVNDILDFSKVEAGALDLVCEPFAPAALAEGCLEIIRELAESKGLAVSVTIDPRLPAAVLGDQARLRQVLLNLLNNALKFTPVGSVRLAASYDGADPRGERIRFSVADTGIGIPVDAHARLFERFFQVDDPLRRDFGGTGLGLAICMRLVEAMGGEIRVASEVGRGSTFTVSVALPRASLPTLAAPADRSVREDRRGRLLLVEDVDVNQELAKAILETAGHEVDVVGDGAAAVEAVARTRYDLVLMDVHMPGMDGLTATRLIRDSHGPEARVPIVALTANVLPEQLDRLREAGLDGHIGKPFDYRELCAIVDSWLSGDRQRDEVFQPEATQSLLTT